MNKEVPHPLKQAHKDLGGTRKHGKEQGYPARPTKEWYTKPPAATEASKDRYGVISSMTKTLETFMFSPFGEVYDSKNYNHLALRYFLVPNSDPQRFFTSEEAIGNLELSFGMLYAVAGLHAEKISSRVSDVADRSIRNTPLNNIASAEWAQCQKEKLKPEEVLQLMALRLHHSLHSDNMLFNFWSNRDILEQTASSVLKSGTTEETVGYLFRAGDRPLEKVSFGVTSQNLMKTILTIKEVNYFLGEPPLHQNLIDPRINDSQRRT